MPFYESMKRKATIKETEVHISGVLENMKNPFKTIRNSKLTQICSNEIKFYDKTCFFISWDRKTKQSPITR